MGGRLGWGADWVGSEICSLAHSQLYPAWYKTSVWCTLHAFSILTPSHPHILTPSHPHTLTSSHPHTLTGVESSVHSHKEKSGFTHARNVEPVTFRPHENYGRGFPYMWRPTGTSIMRQDFSSPHYLRVSPSPQTVRWRDEVLSQLLLVYLCYSLSLCVGL